MKEIINNKITRMKIIAIIGILLLVSLTPMMEALSIKNNTSNKYNFVLNKADITGVNFHVTIGDFTTSTINDNGYTFDRISINNCGYTSDYGKVELPILSYYVAVPQQADIILNYNAANPTFFNNYNIYPAQPPKPDKEGYIDPPFTKNETFYMLNEFYPQEPVEITSLFIIRGCKIARITIYPFSYNPFTKVLKKYNDIDVSVGFSGGVNEYIPERFRSIYFQPIFNAFLINANNIEKANVNNPIQQNTKADRADLLIVVYDPFYEEILPLAQWRHRTGIETKVVQWSEIGSSSQDFRNYIVNAYENWELPPSFLLIVGDADHVPVNYIYNHPYHGTKTGTDLWYVAIDGTDYLPDIHAARISVDNEDELTIVVNKILDYSKTPYMDINWFDDILLAAYNEAGRYFIYTSDRIYNFLTPLGYNCNRQYQGGNPPGSTSGVISAINNGTIIANHRDHGASQNDGYSYTGWSNPKFDTTHITSLTNGRMYPVMYSLNCDSGWFDGETDTEPGNYESIGEIGLRAENKGFVAVLASTRVSYSGYNDEFCVGLYDAMWSDFDPNYPNANSANPFTTEVYRVSQVMNYGKFWMYDKYIVPGGCSPYPWTPSEDVSRTTFEEFHMHGDPTMEIWTSQPENLEVEYEILNNAVKITVIHNENPIENALVCLLQQNGIYLKGLTNDIGEIILNIVNQSDEEVTLTVTAHNYLYYQTNFFLNRPPEKPAQPSGEERPKLNTNYEYVSSSTDYEGENIFYKFNWGDGTESSWLGPYASGESVIASHSWSERGPFSITVKAKDINDGESTWSEGLNIMVGNNIPNKPKVSGPRFLVKPGVECQYSFKLTDKDNDQMYLFVNFGNENYYNWIGPYASGETVQLNHTWQKPQYKYSIHVKVKDQFEETPWTVIQIKTPRNIDNQYNFFERLFERFSILKQFIKKFF
ncbi:MAG: C25 family cysteine peptidase [Thermoplasmatota archaeon]